MAKLKPKARIIRTIGDQLISGPEAALIELVKNAYDADSPWVKIKIEPAKDSDLGKIQVSDNGHGMSSSDVLGRWFEPATDDKLKQRYSRSGTRRMLGAKGIGRFASSRLGSKTNLTSVSRTSEGWGEKTTVKINWRDFESDKYLDELDIPITSEGVSFDHENENVKPGVTLEISDLHVPWSETRLKNLIRELRRLASPSSEDDVFKIYLDLSSFRQETSGFDGVSLLSEENFSVLDAAPEASSEHEPFLILPYKVQEYSDYKLEGQFDASGAFKGEFTITRGDNSPQTLTIPAPKMLDDEKPCGTLRVRINIYDRETSSIEDLFSRMGLDFKKIGIRKARKIISDNAGIGIYRNGFRIRPYGEPDNDWLRLEGRRVQEPAKKLGHIQVAGHIYIEDEEHSGLVERSSREGLEHNGSFERLKRLITGVLVRAEQKRYDFREKAGLSRKPVGDVGRVKDMAGLKKVAAAVAKLPPELQKPLLKQIESESQALTKSLEELEEYQKLLESRSALGLVVAQVIHDGRRLLEPMTEAAKSLITQKDHLFDQTKKGEVVRKFYPLHAETVFDGTKALGKLFKALDPVSGRRRGRPQAFSVSKVISSSINLMGDGLIENGIEVDLTGNESIVAYGYESDMQAALLNIIDNAIYWLSTVDGPKRKIAFHLGAEDSNVRLVIANNGPPVDDGFRDRLFQAGFSLKSEGHGLGLVIGREACRASKGELLFDDMANDTTFIIEFPKA